MAAANQSAYRGQILDRKVAESNVNQLPASRTVHQDTRPSRPDHVSPDHNQYTAWGDSAHDHFSIEQMYLPNAQINFRPDHSSHKTQGTVESHHHPHYHHHHQSTAHSPSPGASEMQHLDRIPSILEEELLHLRNQVKSVSVLQDILQDQRAEIQGFQEVIQAQGRVLEENGLCVPSDVHEKLSQLKLGSICVPDAEWSVELRRPPETIQASASRRPQNTSPHANKELERVTEEVRVLKEEKSQLQHLLQASQDEKSLEISRLRQQLDDQAHDRQTSDAICQSLSGETEVLRTRIQNLVQECQGLTAELSNWKKKKLTQHSHPDRMASAAGAAAAGAGGAGGGVSTAAHVQELERQLEQSRLEMEEVERERRELVEKLREVSRMNKRWQKYSRQQEAGREGVTQANIDLEMRNKLLELQCKDYAEMLKKLQEDLQSVEAQQQHRWTNQSLVAKKEDDIQRLEKQVIDLEQELRQTRRDNSKYDKEVVKQQLKQYTEDFQKEHMEKEKLKREVDVLNQSHLQSEETIQQLSRKLHQAESEIWAMKRRELKWHDDYGYPEFRPVRERRELTPHGAGMANNSFYPAEFPTLPKEDVRIDAPAPSPAVPSPPISPPLSREDVVDGRGVQSSPSTFVDDEPLQCPRCLREFQVSKHTDFMRHTEQCLDV